VTGDALVQERADAFDGLGLGGQDGRDVIAGARQKDKSVGGGESLHRVVAEIVSASPHHQGNANRQHRFSRAL
jgi:hypothetical protein